MQDAFEPAGEPADPFRLGRFVEAQARTWEVALGEVRAGRKSSHWMWYVFPQISGLGRSETARRYAIGSLDEAHAFLAHPLLGPRLREITRAAAGLPGGSARDVFGTPDDLKLRSSLTLFDRIEPDGPFALALDRFFSGERDGETLRLLGRAGDP
ncbi:DUF1810 domain-containing protein [Aureimonas sp. AU4]|uniref:DUF1810 domain-containing protein n=1 Tax=Aureimonas sp. AU4 TaxID=1638163 RepID=UPI000784113A|nr:DUF1810 domain-containing protein [Aureimonas sp. AU4]